MNGMDRTVALIFGLSVVTLLSSISITTAYALSCRGEHYEQAVLTLEKVEKEGAPVEDVKLWQESTGHSYQTVLRGRRDFGALNNKDITTRQLACLEVRATDRGKNYGFSIAQRRCFELILGGQ